MCFVRLSVRQSVVAYVCKFPSWEKWGCTRPRPWFLRFPPHSRKSAEKNRWHSFCYFSFFFHPFLDLASFFSLFYLTIFLERQTDRGSRCCASRPVPFHTGDDGHPTGTPIISFWLPVRMKGTVLLLVFSSFLFCFYFHVSHPLTRRRCRRRSSSSQEQSHGGASDHVLRLQPPLPLTSFSCTQRRMSALIPTSSFSSYLHVSILTYTDYIVISSPSASFSSETISLRNTKDEEERKFQILDDDLYKVFCFSFGNPKLVSRCRTES